MSRVMAKRLKADNHARRAHMGTADGGLFAGRGRAPVEGQGGARFRRGKTRRAATLRASPNCENWPVSSSAHVAVFYLSEAPPRFAVMRDLRRLPGTGGRKLFARRPTRNPHSQRAA